MQIRKPGTGAPLLRALVYAPFGVGKTLFACGAGIHPKMGTALVVNVENGAMSASGLEGVVETPALLSTSDVEDVFWRIANGGEDDDGFDWSSIKTVIIDSGSALQDINISEVAKANATNRKDGGDYSQRDWGTSTRQVRALLGRFCALPKNVIITARQREAYRQEADAAKRALTGPVKAMPDFTPALRRMVCHTVDHVWALGAADNGQRILLTEPDGPYEAKTRGAAFARALGGQVKIRDPSDPDSTGATIGDIFDLLLETQYGQRAE